jgi:nucleoside-diphosphate-sugar epimerase
MKYLILGSDGQIGNYLVKYIKQQNEEVIEYDIKRDTLEDLRMAEPNRAIKQALLEKYINESDFVFFLAWDVGGSKYLSNAESSFDFIHNNMAIMSSVFNLFKKYNKPFIFTSSQMASMTHSIYGNTKIIGERYSQILNGIVVRLWNIYGYEPVDIKSHVITDFIDMALNNGIITMLTDGSEFRQFLYVEDCCEALFILSKLYNTTPRDKDFSISSFKWTSVEEIAKIISNLCNCNYIKGIFKDNVQMSIQEEPNSDILKYWAPKTSLEDGIKNIINKTKIGG